MKAEPSILVVTLLLAIGPAVASAQGTAFTYQGRLNDGSGPASGLYDLRFAIYDAPSSGNVVGGPLTNGAAAVSEGLFTVILDFGAAPFTGAERWLEIAVRTNGAGPFTNLWPRQPITSTPYAIRAANFTGPVTASQLTGAISSNNIGAGTIHSAMLAAGAVTTAALADDAVTAAKLGTVTVPVSLTIITNPTPGVSDFFGASVAAVGMDRVVIGAPNDDTGAGDAGAVYLFSTDGTLIATFTNPTPSIVEEFGASVAGLGSERLLIGAPKESTAGSSVGAAYLFSTSGALLATCTNPTPASLDQFGNAIAAVGNDRVVIGALRDDTSATDAGAAYLFDTNGALLTTFMNPTPSNFAYFGTSVAAVGSDRVLIGAPFADLAFVDAGAAYLFSTNGALLTTFINPTPFANDKFGSMVAALGNDRVLIGAPGGDLGANHAGVAYLFRSNGALLTIFTNPEPAALDEFGYAVAAVGNDRVLIGAYSKDAGATDAGAAYLFSTNGALLMTFTSPTPGSEAEFGNAVAALGNDRVLIGAHFDNTGATNTGAAYLFRVDSYVPGLVAEAVRVGGVSSESIAAGAVTSAQLAVGSVGANQLAPAAVTTAALADGAVTAAKVVTTSNWFPLRIDNPFPAVNDLFGVSVAALGTDRVLIGAWADDAGANNAGAAYLFNANGKWLTTFMNPAPADSDFFGKVVTAVGTDGVLIGAYADNTGASDAGAAYLFSTNGTLLTTFTNPTPASSDVFGLSGAAVGTGRVLIGAPNDNGSTGVAYLFSTNGTLLTAFNNPTPAAFEYFGMSVALLGNDRVIIGAPGDNTGASEAGAAYLFRTNGTLLMTFTNPAPFIDDQFGMSVTALGSDRLLISEYLGDAGGPNAGTVYLFSTNGALLTTFTNPTPASGDLFGSTIAAVGTDRVLIGAWSDSTAAPNSGAAYLFSTNGTLLATFTHPHPAGLDNFGISVAAMGGDQLLIGTERDDTGVMDAGAVYLFGIESFTPGLVADGVRSGSITTASLNDGVVTTAKLADGAVSAAKLDATIGVWTRSGTNVFRSAGNVGIGTSNPALPLDVVGPVRITSIGDGAEALNLNIERAWAFRQLGSGATTALELACLQVNKNFVINTTGSVGIGTTAPAFTLHVNGTAGKPGGGTWSVASDERLKKNIRPLAGALDKLLALHGVNFEYIDPAKIHELSGERMGLLAQEVEKVFPDWVETGPDGYKRVTVRGLEALVVEALRELQQKQDAGNEQLAAELQRRDADNAELKRRLETLERLMNTDSQAGWRRAMKSSNTQAPNPRELQSPSSKKELP